MTSINLQFMLFFKPLSVHSRSIMWRPDGREEKREGGGRRCRERELLHDKVYFSGTRRCHRVRLIVLYGTNKTVPLSLSLHCDMVYIYFPLFLSFAPPSCLDFFFLCFQENMHILPLHTQTVFCFCFLLTLSPVM